MAESGNREITINNAPTKPEVLNIPSSDASIVESVREAARALPAKVTEIFERQKISATQGDFISTEKADKINKESKDCINECLENVGETIYEAVEVKPGDTREVAVVKQETRNQVLQWLGKFAAWIKKKIEQICSAIKKGYQWYRAAKEFIAKLWSLLPFPFKRDTPCSMYAVQ